MLYEVNRHRLPASRRDAAEAEPPLRKSPRRPLLYTRRGYT